jgi:hypothetical protein
MGKTLEELNLGDEPLPYPGWSTFFELDTLIEAERGFDLDDDPLFARFCETIRREGMET